MSIPKAKRAKRTRKIVVFIVLLAVIGGLTALAVFKRREPVITIQTEKVARRNLIEMVEANGRVQPVFQVKISPEVSGEIIELPVKEGQQVKRGDLLLRIKPDVYVADRNSSEANYRASLASRTTAEASLRKAELEYQRIEALHGSQLVSESAFLDAKTGYEIAKAQLQSSIHQVEMAQSALKRAEENLSKTTITAPLDGTISRLNSQLGERVVGTAMMAGTEVMTIADLDAMEARVDIGEMDVILMRAGQVARLEVDAFKDRKFNGVVTEIANSSKSAGYASGQSQDATKFEVKIRIQDKEAFRPGMSVTAKVETRYRTNVLTVPIAAVTTRMPKPPEDATARSGVRKKARPGATNAPPRNPTPGASTNAIAATHPTHTTTAGTNTPAATPAPAAPSTNTPAAAPQGTNSVGGSNGKKPGETPKPIEVVFLKESDTARMRPVKLGISDDSYTEIIEGVQENDEVISGGYKAIRLELEDGKKVRIGVPAAEKAKDAEKK
ncbi:MAG TPA: efflux RND transporter periplasmic adaptor subunit [Verrucomicrobiota bacterium]|nr:efflux RND transporter periplasmic adaptor subunit [Verrucomicrobiota bacterium]HNU51200.1 efflux RND transporter periplasmic adaptor subunit [Verrucomicrobiota bacterium]